MNLFYCRLFGAVLLTCAAPLSSQLHAQSSAPAPQTQTQTPAAPAPQEPATPHGKVLYQSHGDAPATPDQQQPQPAETEKQAPANATPQLTDADRSAIRITRYDLDIRLAPAESELTGRAKLTIRNTSENPLPRIALQISSTLTWQSVSVQGNPLPLAQHLLDTDADHTGRTRELIVTLPTPLAPGDTVALDAFYSGTIAASSERLERLGAARAQALQTDWDAIAPDATALRGFGNVLWFPVATPQIFLQDGTLVPAVGRERLQHADTVVSLHLSVEYKSDPPTAVYFCGRRQPLAALHDNNDAPVAYGSGIATATFPAEPIGIRPLSLFIISQPESMVAPLPSPGPSSSSSSSSTTAAPMLAVESTDDGSLPLLADSAERVAPMLQQWLGPRPLTALTIIDHAGQPFEDGPLLVAPVGTLAGSSSAPLLAHSLTHAWVQTGQPWMDEGLAEFFSLLWIEREHGRDAAIAQLDTIMQQVASADTLVEPATTSSAEPGASSSGSQNAVVGQPLIAAYDELFFRRKAAAVWWMLRDIAGEQPLQLALSAWRTQKPSHDSAEAQAQAFETLLEKTSGKDLSWFFNDWVFHDRGLPALSIVDVTPRELPAGTGHDKGWLVAVTVHNAGAATVEVPLIIHTGEFSTTQRIRVPGQSNATERVIVANPPTEVVVNDGSVPEAGPSTHSRTIVLRQD